MENFHLALMISEGTPTMLVGEGHTPYGFNNTHGHDTAIIHFLWGQLEARKSDHFKFFSNVIKFQHAYNVVSHEYCLGKNDITWHEQLGTTVGKATTHSNF